MQKEEFNKLVDDLNLLLDADAKVLHHITQQFPFFPAAHLLYAKKMQADANPVLQTVVTQAAIHVVDREKLFQIIERTPLAHINNQVSTENEYAENILKETPSAEQIPQEEKPVFEAAPYENEMLSVLSKMDEVKIQLQPVSDGLDDSEEFQTFTGWLTTISGIYNVKTVEPKEQNAPVIVSAEAKTEEKENNFSEDDARKLAARSIEMGDNVITETFALVLAIQGKTQKAIDVYGKLILKYPEKMPYFAAKIEELRKK